MPPRRTSPPRSAEHQAAVDRRLALLSSELAGVRDQEGWPMPDTHTRVRGLRPEPPPEAGLQPGPELPPPLPDPGRHAAHRVVAGRVALGPPQLTVVAVAVALALAIACWWLVRSRASAPTPVAPLSAPATPLASGPVAPPAGSPAGSSAGSPGLGGEVTVDVEGKVRRPGIVVLDGGSRVVDALEAAGGARPRADVSTLNLARVLVDGEQIVVGVPAPSGLPTTSSSGLPPAAGSLVNLNTATETELEALPEVGPVTAQSILSWRDQHGGFTSVNELLEVDGIGDATLQQLLPYVTV
jgi:competence protein ComEA